MTAHSLTEFYAKLPPWSGKVRSSDVELGEPFLDVVRRFADLPGTVALISGGTSDCARYNILGIKPWLTLRGGISRLGVDCNGVTWPVDAQPLSVVRSVLQRYAMAPDSGVPIRAGLLGYLSYDLKDCIEDLPRTSIDDLQLPALYLVAPSLVLVQDLLEQKTTLHLPVLSEETVASRLADFERTLAQPLEASTARELTGGALRSGFSREAYVAAVDAIRDYIVRGHVYQVNMSQRFEASFQGDPFALFTRLYDRNPAPFFAYLNAGDHQIVSTSPERFIQMSGRSLETRPIKGTRPRGKTPDDDERQRLDLISSRKDDAELSMIVDLLRNDIGKVCQAGSVRVTEHKRLEKYENVFHLVSLVHGTLDDDKSAVDVIEATFPGGSITGCPKIRSMEIIDELEPVRRHIYTGSIGYLSFHETMDLSIAIRTATITGGRLVFSVGGGVVYDSNPDEEFVETLHKGRTLMGVFDAPRPTPEAPRSVAWHNGVYRPAEEVGVSVLDEGFAYGYGLFETIRVDRGVPLMLEAHLERFHRSWEYCFDSPPPDITWREVISQVTCRSGLAAKTAAVKLVAAAGAPGRQRIGTLLVTAREYVPRPGVSSGKGLRLASYPNRRQSHLSEHKTMNYMFYRMAAGWAKKNGCDEALILNSDGTVSETNTANLLWMVGEQIYRPNSGHSLPGIMESAVCALLARWDRAVERRPLALSELKAADHVFLSNALMGLVPVCQIDETPFDTHPEFCRRVNEVVLGSPTQPD